MKLRSIKWVPNEKEDTYSVRIDNALLKITLFECRLKDLKTVIPQVECVYLELFGVRQPIIDTDLGRYVGTRQRCFGSFDEAKAYFEAMWNDMFEPLIFDETFFDEKKRKTLNEAKMVAARLNTLLQDFSRYDDEGINDLAKTKK